MAKFRVYPYKQGSESAKKFADSVNGKVLRHVGSKFRPRAGDVVVNWGASGIPDFAPATTLNSAEAVEVAGCKFKTLVTLQQAGVRVPRFVVNRDEVEVMGGFPVVCRTKLRGHSGDGIVIADTLAELVDAPLYTRYVKKKDEYRVHVFRGEVIFIQRKARKLEEENPNWQVRNLAGGFVFAEAQEADVPVDILNQSRAAVTALGLDFGGVDVLWNDKEQKAYVLEVNTACGLEDRTAERYATALRHLVEDR